MISKVEAPGAVPAWTLADVLSSFRYWVFVLAVLLAACAMRIVQALLPMVASQTGASYSQIGWFSIGTSLGWVVGGIMALLLMPRRPKLTLMLPIAGVAVSNAAVLAVPDLWIVGPYLLLQGICAGAFTLLSIVSVASLLTSGRLSRTDFIHAFTLPILLVSTVPQLSVMTATLAADANNPLQIMGFGLLAYTLVALLFLALARPLGFEDTARARHRPITPRRRSPIMVALIGLVPAVLLLALFAISRAQLIAHDTTEENIWFTVLVGAGVLAAAAVLYSLYWLYRIHGEVAHQAASQRLLTPIAATAISLLAPLGYLLVLINLGRVLRDRGTAEPSAGAFSFGWLALWCVIAPPIAMGMIQAAVNGQE